MDQQQQQQQQQQQSREDKIALARMRLQQFQRKRQSFESGSSIHQQSSPHSVHTPLEPSEPQLTMDIAFDSSMTVHGERPMTAPASGSSHANAAARTASKAEGALDASRLLERLEYIEGLNGILSKENQTLMRRTNELKDQLLQHTTSMSSAGQAMDTTQATVSSLQSQLASLNQVLLDKDQLLQSAQQTLRAEQEQRLRMQEQQERERGIAIELGEALERSEAGERMAQMDLHSLKQAQAHVSDREEKLRLDQVHAQERITQLEGLIASLQQTATQYEEAQRQVNEYKQVMEAQKMEVQSRQQSLQHMHQVSTAEKEHLEQLRKEFEAFKVKAQQDAKLNRSKLEDFRRELAEAMDRNVSLETRNRELEQMLAESKNVKEEARAVQEESRVAREQTRLVREESQSLIVAKDEIIRQLQLQISTLESQSTETIRRLELDLHNARDELTQLHAASEWENKYTEVSSRFSVLEQEKSNALTHVSQLQSELTALSQKTTQLGNLELHVVELKLKLEALEQEKEGAVEESSRLRLELDRLSHVSAQAVALEQKVQEVQGILCSTEKEKTDLTSQVDQLRLELDRAEESSKQVVVLEQKVHDVQGILSTAEKEKMDLKAQIDRLRLELDQMSLNMSESARLEQSVHELNLRINVLIQEKTEALEKVSQLEQSLSDVESRTADKLKDAEDAAEKATKVVLDLQDALRSNEQEMNNAREELGRVQFKVKELKQQLRTTEQEKAKALEELRDGALHSAQRDQSRLLELQDATDKASKLVIEMQEAMQTKDQELEALREALEFGRGQQDEYQSQLAQMASELEEAQQQVTNARRQISAHDEEQSARSMQFQQMERSHRQTMDDLHAELESLRSEVSDLQTRIHSLTEENQSSKYALAESRKQIKKLESQLEESQSHSVTLQQQLTEKDDILRESESTMDRLKQEKDHRVADLKSQIASLQKQLHELQTATDSDQKAAMQKMRGEYDQEIHSLKDQLRRLESDHIDQHKQHQSALAGKDKAVKNLTDEVEEKRSQIRALDTTLTKLKESMAKSRDERAALMTKQLGTEIEALKSELDRIRKETSAKETQLESTISNLKHAVDERQRMVDESSLKSQEAVTKMTQMAEEHQNMRELIAEGLALIPNKSPGSPRRPSMSLDQRLTVLVDGVRDELSLLQSRLDEMQYQATGYQQSLSKADHREKSLAAEVAVLKETVNELHSRLEEAEADHSKTAQHLQQQLVHAQQQLALVQQELKDYQHKDSTMSEIRASYEAMKSQSEQALRLLGELKHKEIADLSESSLESMLSMGGVASHLADQLLQQRQHQLRATKEMETMHQQVQDLTAQREDLSLRFQRLVNERDAEEVAIGPVRKEMESINAQLHKTKDSLQDVTGQWRRATDTVKEKNAEIEDLGRKLASALQEIDGLRNHGQKAQVMLTQEKASRREVELKIARLEDEHRKLDAVLKQEKESASSTIGMMEQLLSEERDRNLRLTESVEHLKKTLNEKAMIQGRSQGGSEDLALMHEQEKAELHRVLDVTKKQVDEAHVVLSKLQDINQQQELELAKEKDEREKLVNFVRDILGTLPDVSITTVELFDMDSARLMEKFKIELAMLTRRGYGTGDPQIEGYEQHVHQLKQRVIDLQADNHRLRTQVDELKIAVDHQRNQVSQMEAEQKLQQVRAQSPEPPLDHRTIEQYETMLRNLKDQLHDADDRIRELTQTLESSDRKHRAFLDAHEDKIRELENELVMARKSQPSPRIEPPRRLPDPSPLSPSTPANHEEIRRQLMEKTAEMEDMRLSSLQTAGQMEVLRSKIQDYESALEQAQNTIGMLNQDIKDRVQLTQDLKKEIESLHQRLVQRRSEVVTDDERSPTHLEKHMESVMNKANDTMRFIDEIGRLGSSHGPRVATTSAASPIIPDSAMTDLLRLLQEQAIMNDNAVDGNLRLLTSNENLKSKILHVQNGLKAQKSAAVLLVQLSEKAVHMVSMTAKAHLTTAPAIPASVEAAAKLDSAKMKMVKDSFDALLAENEAELATLRESVMHMTQAERYAREAIGSDTEHQMNVNLLQSHVQQLRKIWDHEVKANEVLRRIIAELRSRYQGVEKEFMSQAEKLYHEAELMKSRLQDTHVHESQRSALLQENEAARLQLEQELVQLKTNMEHMERDWQTERSDALAKIEKFIREVDLIKAEKLENERGWHLAKDRLVQELDQSKASLRELQESAQRRSVDGMKRLTEDFGRKEAQLRKDKETIELELQSLKKQMDKMQREHQRALDKVLADRRVGERQVQDAATDREEAMVKDLQRKHRDEKEQILLRFKEKMVEFEQVQHQQQRLIERLKDEKAELIAEKDQVIMTAQRTQTDERVEVLNLQKEVLALREHQKDLYEQLRRERLSPDTYHKLDRDLQRQIKGKDAQVKRMNQDMLHYGKLHKSHSSGERLNDPADLRREKDRHKEHCRMLMSEITVLRIKYKREAGYHADLIYQKNFMMMLLGGADSCATMASHIGGLRLTANPTWTRWKKAIWSALAIARMRILRRRYTVAKSQLKQAQQEKERIANSVMVDKEPKAGPSTDADLHDLKTSVDRLRADNERLMRKVDEMHLRDLM